MPRHAVMVMLKAIEWEKQKKEEGKPEVFFNIAGSDSKLATPIPLREYDSYEELIKTVFGSEGIDSSPDSLFYKSIILIDKNGKKKIVRKKTAEGNQYTSPQCVFIQNSSNDKWSEVRIPDNPTTWARKKMECCRIYLKGNTLQSLLDVQNGYIDKGLNAVGKSSDLNSNS